MALMAALTVYSPMLRAHYEYKGPGDYTTPLLLPLPQGAGAVVPFEAEEVSQSRAEPGRLNLGPVFPQALWCLIL